MKLPQQSVIVVLCFIGLACPYYIKHSPELAVETGRKFGDVVFVRRDFSFGLEFLAKHRTPEYTEVSLSQFVEAMHPYNDYPTEIRAIGYEFIPGNRRANVYLEGTDGTKKSYYRIELEGDAQSAYFVTGLYRRLEMFEKSSGYKPV